MNDILEFDLINPILDNTSSFYNKKKNVLYLPNPQQRYKYYVECARNFPKVGRRYFILLGINKFSDNCRKCRIDGYNRITITPRGEFREYLEDCCKETRNIEVGVEEYAANYDIYYVNADNM